ncbi:MAG: hypothetical protein IPK60_08615 [Sandaracinaceae bacterium]|nr:hypothetical protein [Sandaracinaceae bacterium]
MASPIVARVMHAAKDLVTVTQELSFLKLGRGVSMRVGDEMETRRGKIDGIDLSFTGDVPSLVLQVVYDEMPSAEQSATARVERLRSLISMRLKWTTLSAMRCQCLETATMTTATVTTATVTTTTTNVTKERDGVRVIRTEGEFDRERLASINARSSIRPSDVVVEQVYISALYAKRIYGPI